MQAQNSKAQDNAINCLLQEYQKQDHISQNTWADHQPSPSTPKLKQLPSYLGYKTAKPRTLFKHNMHQNSKKDNYNPQMLESTGINATEWMEMPKHELSPSREQSKYEIQGSYWWSKVNWTSFGNQESHLDESRAKSQRKGFYRVSGDNNDGHRRLQRYDQNERSKDQQYRNNLIYSILKKEKNVKEDNKTPKNRGHTTHQSLLEMGLQKSQKDSIKMEMRESMRQSLRKFVSKNRQQGSRSHYFLEKKDEQRRSSFVREMLNNMDNLKEQRPDSPLLLVKKSSASSQHSTKSRSQFNKAKPYRIAPQKSQQLMPGNRVLDLNMQAQRIYKSKSVTRRQK